MRGWDFSFQHFAILYFWKNGCSQFNNISLEIKVFFFLYQKNLYVGWERRARGKQGGWVSFWSRIGRANIKGGKLFWLRGGEKYENRRYPISIGIILLYSWTYFWSLSCSQGLKRRKTLAHTNRLFLWPTKLVFLALSNFPRKSRQRSIHKIVIFDPTCEQRGLCGVHLFPQNWSIASSNYWSSYVCILYLWDKKCSKGVTDQCARWNS